MFFRLAYGVYSTYPTIVTAKGQAMRFKNSSNGYGLVTQGLHWATAILLVNQFVTAAMIASQLGGAGVYGWHKVVGTWVMLVVFARLVWRKATKLPDFAPGLFGWEISFIEFVERALYVLLLVMPISGVVMSVAGSQAVPMLGLFTVGPIDSPIIWLAKTGRLIHVASAWLLAGAIAVHVTLVLRRHWYEKGGYADRMNPFSKD